VQSDANWAEFDFGAWDGCRADALPADAVAAFHADPLRNPPPGGEDWEAFGRRIADALQALLVDAGESRAPRLVVSHAGALRMALSQACGLPLAALWSLRIDYGTRLRLRLEAADDGHLWGELLELVQP
jgi:alpha-ribazole phosphatase